MPKSLGFEGHIAWARAIGAAATQVAPAHRPPWTAIFGHRGVADSEWLRDGIAVPVAPHEKALPTLE